MLFSDWRINTAFEAIVCLACAVIFFLLGEQTIFALSLIFLFSLVPSRAFRFYARKTMIARRIDLVAGIEDEPKRAFGHNTLQTGSRFDA